jgi:hypothetical protein
VVGVAELLVSFTPAEIKAALDEYITPIDGTADRAAGIKAFFSEGGGAAIIHVRRSREPAAPKATGALGELRHSSDSDAIAKREKETAEKRAKAEAALKAKQAAEKLAIEKAAADKAAAEAIAAAEKARIAEEQARIAEEKRVREAAESEQRNAKIRAEREAAEVKRAAERDQKQMGFECRHHGKCDAHLVPFVYTTVGVCPDMQCAHEDCVAQLDKDGSVQYRAHIAQGAGNTDCLLCQRQASAPSAAEELAAVQQ